MRYLLSVVIIQRKDLQIDTSNISKIEINHMLALYSILNKTTVDIESNKIRGIKSDCRCVCRPSSNKMRIQYMVNTKEVSFLTV